MEKNNIKIDDKELLTPEHDRLCIWVDNNFENIIAKTLGLVRLPEYEIVYKKLEWESPIKNIGYVIGIPDFKYTFTIRTVKEPFLNFCGFIECKPHILSIGDTMRQLKLYKSYYFTPHDRKISQRVESEFKFPKNSTYEQQMDFILITYDKKYKDLFEKQNIKYLVVNPKL